MKHHIGFTAGMIWELLREKGEMNTSQIARLTKVKSNVVHMAVGWLAREDKVVVRDEDDKLFVALV